MEYSIAITDEMISIIMGMLLMVGILLAAIVGVALAKLLAWIANRF